ncbi:glycosyltransferase family 2 protein [Mucilaginibacter sp. L196]|uniref:glycosyltransferase family 2 protein n=1 Tax=Mucilaginibacter sp. L196 TaxID=1641870 RepID=UPI00131C6C2A|nr:glycosyltransferase family 2 protein [Mucilaginibacter sp. L196]
MENLPLVSIALCTYNGEKYLSQQIDTLLAQTYHNLEIIAVDDCSSDNTHNILLNYAKKYPGFTVYRNEINVGFLRNFETALGYCKGEYISFCDQDDLWHPNKVELTVAAIKDSQFVYHDSEFIDDDNNLMGKKMSDIFKFYRGDRPEPFLLDNCVSGHAMLVRRDLIKHALPFKKGFYHDWWLAYVATNVGKIDFIPDCLVQYRQHKGSNTDLLDLSKVEKRKLGAASITKKLLNEKRWLEHCLSYQENKNPEFVKTLYQLYIGRFNSFTAISFYLFLKKHADVLFFFQNWKKKALYKYIWGYKAKNYWYSYVRPNKDKILKLED